MRQAMKMPTQKAVELAISDLAKWGFEKANQSLKNSITSNWTGLFEPKQAVQTYTNAYSGYQTQASTRMSEIQELIAQEEQGNATYGF